MGEIRAMDSNGDSKHIWDSTKKDEVDAARDMFDRLTKKGYKAFSVQKKGAKGDPITKFDPELEKIILVPPIAGG